MLVITTLLMAIHLIAVNLASAGPLVCIGLHQQGRRGHGLASLVGRKMAAASLAALLVGIAFGLILLGLAWQSENQAYWNMLQRIPVNQLWYALGEMAFSGICLLLYVWSWQRMQKWSWTHAVLALLSSTNLLYHFPPWMAALSYLAVKPELVDETMISRAHFLHLMARPDILSQSVHFCVASIAVSGWVMMIITGRQRRTKNDDLPNGEDIARDQVGGDVTESNEYDRLIRSGAWIVLATSLLQIVIGFWVLLQLPNSARNRLLGDDWLTTGLFFLAILGTFGMMHLLTAIGMGETNNTMLLRLHYLFLLIILLMVFLMRSTVTDTGPLAVSDMVGASTPPYS